ncbi:MAG: hypothetical protein HY716_08465 [Planctomycetes bacterium]|nr:hypothetical protein [Planctomycetota bacterium]
MRFITTVTALTFVLSLAAPAQEEEKVALGWKFTKGDKFRYEYASTFESESDGGDSVQWKTAYGLDLEVTAVDKDGTATLKATFDRIKLTYSDDEDDVDVDSTKKPPKGDVAAKIVTTLIGKPMDIRLTRRGECKKFEGIDKVVDTVLEDLDEEDEALVEKFKQHFSDDVLQGQIQTEFGQLPEKPVAKGGKWEGDQSLPEPTNFGVGGGRAWPSKFTLKEVREGGKQVVISQDGGPTRDDIDGEVKSDRVWDVAKGRMQSTKRKATMESQGTSMTYTAEMKLATPKEKAK